MKITNDDILKEFYGRVRVRNGKEYYEIRWHSLREHLGNPFIKNGYKITKEDLAKIIQNTRKVIDCKWYELAGLNKQDVILSKEVETLTFIKDCFSFTEVLFQHSVCGYKIDMYLPEFKVAIECDEFGHCNNTDDEEREDIIMKEFGCKFIRFNPDEKDFKIQKVIRDINKAIMSK